MASEGSGEEAHGAAARCGWLADQPGRKIMPDDIGLMVSDDRQVLDICAGGIDLPHFQGRTEQFRNRAQLLVRLALVS